MKKAISVILALTMLIGIFAVPLQQSFAATQNTIRVTTSVLNVRDGVWGNWMGSVYKDQEYTSTENKKDSSGDTWYAISFHGQKGWVHGDFVDVIASSGSTSSSASGKLTVTADTLNVRKSVWGTIVDAVYRSQTYAYTDTAKDSSGDTWYKISLGWVHGDHVKAEGTASSGSSSSSGSSGNASAKGSLTIDAEALRVRDGAWGEYLTTVYRGSQYEYLGTQKASDGSTWYQIEVNGTKGYVHGDYVTLKSTTTTPPASGSGESVKGSLQVTTAVLNVRSSVWGNWVASAYENENYDYLSTAKDSSGKTWYKIKLGSSTGWVHGDFVKVLTTGSSSSGNSGTRKVLGTLYVTTSVLNVRDAIWGNWIGETYNSVLHDYYATKKDSSGNTWYEIAYGKDSGWIHGDFVSLTNPNASGNVGDVIASSKGTTNVYALEEFSLEVKLKDSSGKAITGKASSLGVTISGAERPKLVSVGSFREVSSGVYRATAKISDAHQSVRFSFTLSGTSLGETATVNTGASEFQERWLSQNVGVYMNLDGVYGYQCKDVLDSYAYDMFGDFRTIVGRGDAAQLYDGASEDYFIKIPRASSGPNAIPKMGDVIVYGGGSRYTAGHLAVVISADATTIRVLEQNSNGTGSTPAMYDTRGYSSYSGEVVGWLRPRVEKIKNAN